MSPPLYEPVDPEAYLDLARLLSLRGEVTAKRTAADRAYYAAFLPSRNLLAEKGYITPHGDERDHQYVIEALKRQDVLGSFGNEGLRLRRTRNIATYDTGEITAISHRQAHPLSWMLRTAETMIEKVKRLPARTNR